MSDPTLSQALMEAYASCPSDDVTLHTIELRHPAFDDGAGNNVAIRVVRDHVDLTATLEVDAPMNGGESVVFQALGFEMELPPVDGGAVPEMSLSMDNVGREISDHLSAASRSLIDVEVTYRAYLQSDLSGPQNNPPLTLSLATADVGTLVATATASIRILSQ